jgi:ParB/RepB/Spo0J family partition protein
MSRIKGPLKPTYRTIEISKIKVSNDRRQIDPAIVASIAVSIKETGQNQPISLVKVGGWGENYELVTGAHRLAACNQLKYKTIEAVILTKKDALIVMHTENLLRNESALFDRYNDIVGYMNASTVARKAACSQPHDQGISRAAKALKLDRRTVRQAVAAQKIGSDVRGELQKLNYAENASVIEKVAAAPGKKAQLKIIRALGRRSAPARKPVVHRPASYAVLKQKWERSGFRDLFDLADKRLQAEFVSLTFKAILKHASRLKTSSS